MLANATTQTPRKAYSTDLTDQQWELIEPMLPPAPGGGRDRQVSMREIVNAILYRTRTGCAWDLLPHDLPPKSTVFEYYRKWQLDGTWQSVHDQLRTRVRVAVGKNPTASVGLIDSQSTKTTEEAEASGYDAGKKVKGRKRHIMVDTLGLLIVVAVTLANVQDRDGAKILFASCVEASVATVFADGAYRGKLIGWAADQHGKDLQIVEREAGQKGFVVLKMRWIVERTFGWLNRYRLLSKEYETTLESSTADIQIAMSNVMLRRLTRPPKNDYPNEHLLAHIT